MPTGSDRPAARPGSGRIDRWVPMLCLIGVIMLVSSITPAIKYTLQYSTVDFLELASVRIVIGFLFLAGITAWIDLRGLRALTVRQIVQLTLLGMLGAGGYPIGAWGLTYTSVTHFAIIYSLLPTFTALISIGCRRDRANVPMMSGLLLSWTGCLLAVTGGTSLSGIALGFGDALILLFTIMMSCYLVLSPGIVKRLGVWTSNTTMFGTTSVLILAGDATRGTPPHTEISGLVLGLLLFIGTATAGVFLLRSRALQSLTPAIVGAYHNLIPVCTIGLAYLLLNESVTTFTILGAAAVVAGTELVRRAQFLSLPAGRS